SDCGTRPTAGPSSRCARTRWRPRRWASTRPATRSALSSSARRWRGAPARAGVAGGLSGAFEGNLAPQSFTFVRSFEVVAMVVLGGMGSITGSTIAAVVLTILPEYLRALANLRMVIYSVALIALMLLRPRGLLGTTELWDYWRR